MKLLFHVLTYGFATLITPRIPISHYDLFRFTPILRQQLQFTSFEFDSALKL